jgi:hypothetical protein
MKTKEREISLLPMLRCVRAGAYKSVAPTFLVGTRMSAA